MELKYSHRLHHLVADSRSNRTFMELKSRTIKHNAQGRIRSNRTFMELKWRKITIACLRACVLIAPLWN